MKLIMLNKEDFVTPDGALTPDHGLYMVSTHQARGRRGRDTAVSARHVNDSAQATTSFVLSVAKCDLSSWGFVPQCLQIRQSERREKQETHRKQNSYLSELCGLFTVMIWLGFREKSGPCLKIM